MRILEYTDLNISGVEAPYKRAVEAIARGDFRAADVKKLAGATHMKLYRARLDYSARLLLTLVRWGGETCVLMLEVILNHDYSKSRFLRGIHFDESKIKDASLDEAEKEAEPLGNLHALRSLVHVLDKPICFNDAQYEVYERMLPLIVVGCAGSGKTALILERLKRLPGNVLYVTQSPYLARNARDTYYSLGFMQPLQQASFLSYRELLESIRMPPGREAQWHDFSEWFGHIGRGPAARGIDPHQAFEEIRGVLSAQAGGVLSREAYLALGVRESIFGPKDRERVHDLFLRYREWLGKAGLYDVNLIAHQWLKVAAQRYDSVVVDEVQDLTMVQLALVLKTLKNAESFMLCGDSNQIVHPNFFSWKQVKKHFWEAAGLTQAQELQVLVSNFRNGPEATRVANTLLKIKQRRFGSVDRETNYLVQANPGAESGEVVLLPDTLEVKRELDQRTHASAQVAVLVMRDEDKAAAREHFSTPLIFSIHEAKGLEYKNIVLYGFVSGCRSEFAEICAGVTPQDLEGEALEYSRARDKDDKSLEVYKFFVNALYVALTRGIRNVYLIESDTSHPLVRLLGLAQTDAEVKVAAHESSREEWRQEARRLELQGKQEQAQAIRSTMLAGQEPGTPIPGAAPGPQQLRKPLDDEMVRTLLASVFAEIANGGKVPGDNTLRQLSDFADYHDMPVLSFHLARETGYGADNRKGPSFELIEKRGRKVVQRLLEPYAAKNFKTLLKQCDNNGVDERTLMGHTPLMAATCAGNLPLVEALLARGADPDATDMFGCNALHLLLRQMFRSPDRVRASCAALYERLAPSHVDLKAAGRLVRIDRVQSEYLLLQTIWALYKPLFNTVGLFNGVGFDAGTLLSAWLALPEQLVPADRRRKEYISRLLSHNEVHGDYASSRPLFKRVMTGIYHLNPALDVRVRTVGGGEAWMPVHAALNLPLIHEGTLYGTRPPIQLLMKDAGLPPPQEPEITRLQTMRILRQLGPFWFNGQMTEIQEVKAPLPWGNLAAEEDAMKEKRQREEMKRREEFDGPQSASPYRGPGTQP